MNEKLFAVFRSIWFWWLLTTSIYTIFCLLGFLGAEPSLLGYIAGFLGLFVPYGLQSSFLLLYPPAWFSLVVFFVIMFAADRRLDKNNLSFGKRVLLNLLILLIVTIIVDLIRGTPFMSWTIFFSGAFL